MIILADVKTKFKTMTLATEQNLDWQKLLALPTDSSWAKVTHISAKGNGLTELTDNNCQNLGSVRILKLYHNNITIISPFIGQLDYLTELWLGHNNLVSLPPEIALLDRLTYLDLSSNQLEIFPIGISNLSRLIHLDLGRNKLRQVPPELFALRDLQFLNLGFNQLTTLGPSIADCCALQSLYLNDNQLGDLPDDIGYLGKLLYLEFENNLVTSFPESMRFASSLVRLNGSNNRLDRLFDAGVGFSEFNLEDLQLANNQITGLPWDFWRLPFLSTLNLTTNLLGKTPFPLFNLPKSLTHLYLSSNGLHSLPYTVSELPNLVELYVCNNFLTSYFKPSTWPKLEVLNLNYNVIPCCPLPLPPKIKELSLIHNQIRTLPATQLVGSSLKRLWIGDNPVSKKRFTGMQTRSKSKTQSELFEKLPDLDVCSPRAKKFIIENIV